MRTQKIIGAALFGVAFAAAATALGAQSMSTLTNAKRVASNAAAATNEHTRKEQDVGSGKDAAAPTSAAASHTTTPAAGKSGVSARSATAKKPVTPARKSAAASAHSGAAAARGARGDEPEKGPGNEVTLLRESFTYHTEGRRDPFVSLIASGELRPMISDLRLVTVIYDPAGRSVAVMRDMSTHEQYRVKSGQTIGRMRVARIGQKSVTFTIEEYGFSRQEVLALNDSTRARSQ